MNSLRVAHVNARSLLPKFHDICHFVFTKKIDILAISESWLTTSIDSNSVSLNDFTLFRSDRISRGGGVCLYVRSCLRPKLLTSNKDIEQLWVAIKLTHITVSVGVAYKPPKFDYRTFVDAFEESLSDHGSSSDIVICCGDINIDLLKPDETDTVYLRDMLDSLDLKQIIDKPTRITENSRSLVDLLMCSSQTLFNQVEVESFPGSDHESILSNFNIQRIKPQPVLKMIRDFRGFNFAEFENDLGKVSFHRIFYLDNIDDKLDFLNCSIAYLFDQHAPLKYIKVSRGRDPWITDNVQLLMSLRNKAKQKFKRTKLSAHWNYYKSLRNLATLSIRNEKKAYFRHMAQQNDSKKLWRELRRLNIVRAGANDIPYELREPHDINNFFIDSLPPTHDDQALISFYGSDRLGVGNGFSFSTVTEEVVLKLLLQIKSNSTGLDGLNIEMIRLCCPLIVPYLTHIINVCLCKSIFPTAWKNAMVIPIPKTANPSCYAELRPISILPTFSKVMERIISTQINSYLATNNILSNVQSGFRPGYSCETALLNITDDIVGAADVGQLTALVLLDYTKAFDTISHAMMIAKLHYIGFDQGALSLIKDYLHNRTQLVKVSGLMSGVRRVECGVPQGSILGPLLFTIYTYDFNKVLDFCNSHMYADDTQLYYSFTPSNYESAVNEINSDLCKLQSISSKHSLHINLKKSGVLLFGNKCVRANLVNVIDCRIGGEKINIFDKMKNLGVVMDSNLRFREHVGGCVVKAYNSLRLLYPHRSSLDHETKKRMCEALVLSHFTYCSVLYGPCLDGDTSRKIQRVQNSCVRYISGLRKYDHISDCFRQLTWLNMSGRRRLSAASLYHKILISAVPDYLYGRIRFRGQVHSRNLRGSALSITPPLHKTALYERGFTFNVYRIYSEMMGFFKDCTLRNFKKRLKNYLLLEN